jgi:V/A-type H+-transporting ATPase subunit A
MKGKVTAIFGATVSVDIRGLQLYDRVYVGHNRLTGEVVHLELERTTVQVFENTRGLAVGEPAEGAGVPLTVKLGPGLLGGIYDGLQRPLPQLQQQSGAFIRLGKETGPLDLQRVWTFVPQKKAGESIAAGERLGQVAEGALHHPLYAGVGGVIERIVEGEFRLSEPVAVLDNGEQLFGWQDWAVRRPRPCRTKRPVQRPLITGQRCIDFLFPLMKGGVAIIPGGFGTGKTVTEHSLARWAEADVVVYVGCGERGNEMTEVLEEFPTLEDPRYGAPLMERTILIANTSNMPVAAREASIYTGITMAEYYRDMGYDVVLLADSTSRWGEALREISGRLEEMPGEEGYPAYLAARLSEFYERSGRVTCLGANGGQTQAGQTQGLAPTRTGSVTVVGAVSPPGGDFSEPMTQNSLRVVGTFWALDYDLSRRRHFPSINWTRSYTLYNLREWYSRAAAPEWNDLIREAMALLQREVELLEIVQLVGPDALAEAQREVLAVARMLREDFLQQSAYHETDRFCPLPKACWMLRTILEFHRRAAAAVGTGISLERLTALPVVAEIARMKELPVADAEDSLKGLIEKINSEFANCT